MKWQVTGKPWFRKMMLWAWWEILCTILLFVAVSTLLIVAYMTNWLVFAGAVAIATIAIIWHWGWLGKRTRECLLIVLLLCVIAPLTIGAGYGIGTHKAEDWSKLVTYDFSPKKEEKKEPDEKKSKKAKKLEPGEGEYFDGQFAKIREEMSGLRSEVKGVRSEVDGMKKRLKINFELEDEPLDFPVMVKPAKEPELLPPPPPDPENDPDSGLKLKIAPEAVPPKAPLEDEPQPIKRKIPEPIDPGRFRRSEPASPGKTLRPPSIASDDRNDPIVASLCTNGVEHPIAQFCENESGGIRFVDEAKDRCKNDPKGKPCTCARWLKRSEIANR